MQNFLQQSWVMPFGPQLRLFQQAPDNNDWTNTEPMTHHGQIMATLPPQGNPV